MKQIIFRDVVTKERYRARRVTEDIADLVDAKVGDWILMHEEGAFTKVITAVQSVTEFEEVPD